MNRTKNFFSDYLHEHKYVFIFSLFGALCHDAGYVELIISQSRRDDVKAPPTQKTDWSTKQDRAIRMLSLSHARCMDSHTGTPTRSRSLSCARYMISHTHTVTRALLLARSGLRETVPHLRACGSCYQYAGDSRNFRESWDVWY